MGKAPARPASAAKGKPAAMRGGGAMRGAVAMRKGGKKPAAKQAAFAPLLSPTNRMVALLGGIALVPFALPTLLLLIVGMLPTIAAVVAERSTSRQAWISVGGLNFAGLAHWLLNLWFAHHTMGYAIQQLRTVTPLLVAYGASAVGWALYLAMPPLVNAITTVTSQRRVVTLAAQQRKLVELWGDSVISRDAKPAEPAAAPAAPGPAGNGASSAAAPGRA